MAGAPGFECCIVPRVKRLNPLFPCTTSIALQTVGVSTCLSKSYRLWGIILLAIVPEFRLCAWVVPVSASGQHWE